MVPSDEPLNPKRGRSAIGVNRFLLVPTVVCYGLFIRQYDNSSSSKLAVALTADAFYLSLPLFTLA